MPSASPLHELAINFHVVHNNKNKTEWHSTIAKQDMHATITL